MVDVGDVGSGCINRRQAGSYDYGSSPGRANVSAKWKGIRKYPQPPSIVTCRASQEWAQTFQFTCQRQDRFQRTKGSCEMVTPVHRPASHP